MKTFDFKSGTKVMVDEHRLVIERTGGKSAMKGLFAGRAMGQMTIKTSAMTGLIHFAAVSYTHLTLPTMAVV